MLQLIEEDESMLDGAYNEERARLCKVEASVD